MRDEAVQKIAHYLYENYPFEDDLVTDIANDIPDVLEDIFEMAENYKDLQES